MNYIHSVHLNCFLLKRVSLPKVPWEAVGLSAAYNSFNLGSSTASGHSANQVCGLYHHFILTPNQILLSSLASTPQCHRPWLESLGALSFPMVTLALWPFPSSLPQPQGWCGDPPVWFSSKLLSALISQPSWMGLLSQTQCSLPCDREDLHSCITYWRTGWPPMGTRLQLWLSSLLARLPGVCWWSNILHTHRTVGANCLLHLPVLVSPVYNVFCWGVGE